MKAIFGQTFIYIVFAALFVGFIVYSQSVFHQEIRETAESNYSLLVESGVDKVQARMISLNSSALSQRVYSSILSITTTVFLSTTMLLLFFMMTALGRVSQLEKQVKELISIKDSNFQ